jgi:hypothetical protein
MVILTEKEIKEILSKEYDGDSSGRELTRDNIINQYNEVGTVFFSLEGSPPKGYAIYIKGVNAIIFYDGYGEKFKEIDECILSN